MAERLLNIWPYILQNWEIWVISLLQEGTLLKFWAGSGLEVLLQSCHFAYMNRFTDGLRLPSEDEAIKVYQETYGKSFEELRKAKY